MKRNFLYVFIAALLFAIYPLFSQGVFAGTLSFDQSTYTVAVGQTINVQVVVDASTDSLHSTDAVIAFDSSLLKATNVAGGTYFPTVSNDIATAGKVTIYSMVDDPATSKTGKGTIATITFQGIANGIANLTFDCANSKIIKSDVNATNVIQCSQNTTAAVTVGSGTGTSTANPTPSVLPRTGVFDNVIKFAAPGVILMFVGMMARLLL
ncbi:MAG: cohesin domain-containing protein [bacterium]|nr:cohesin domain-containing protein [bacterium]